jgi:hypothetical protein
MATFILMTSEQADHVRGPALNPIERQGSVFILNTLVLSDPTHAQWHEYLSALPTMDLTDPAFPPAIEPVED